MADPRPRDKTYFDVPQVASVRWDDASSTVIVEWKGWANSTEFGGLLDAEVRALRENRGSRLLADCRRQRVISPADQEKANKEWLPRALAAGLQRFAIILPISQLAALNLRERLGEVTGTLLRVGYFDSIESATEWLGSED